MFFVTFNFFSKKTINMYLNLETHVVRRGEFLTFKVLKTCFGENNKHLNL